MYWTTATNRSNYRTKTSVTTNKLCVCPVMHSFFCATRVTEIEHCLIIWHIFSTLYWKLKSQSSSIRLVYYIVFHTTSFFSIWSLLETRASSECIVWSLQFNLSDKNLGHYIPKDLRLCIYVNRRTLKNKPSSKVN